MAKSNDTNFIWFVWSSLLYWWHCGLNDNWQQQQLIVTANIDDIVDIQEKNVSQI